MTDSRVPNRLRRLLERRPPRSDLSAQMFWLVDVIFACSESNLTDEAALLRSALGHLGRYLEEGQAAALGAALNELAAFEERLHKEA